MRLIQFLSAADTPAVGQVISPTEIQVLDSVRSVYALAQGALREGISLKTAITRALGRETLSYDDLIRSGRLLSPFTHPEPSRLFVTGTGLTHLGSADTRASMHAKTQNTAKADLTDSMKMFQQGVAGGKPEAGQTGAQPEWFYKGNGTAVVAPEAPLPSPDFALDAGEEPEIAGCYVNDDKGQPWRIGYALGNEFSDHKTERQNYLLLAHSKLRPCSIGPELLIDELPARIEGYSRIWRDGQILWEKPFLSGEDNMCHSLDNLEHHHFKYELFRQPGDAHLHFFGTATLSFADSIETRAGDIFEIEAEPFGRALRNPIAVRPAETSPIKPL
ncbi:FAH family protein [Natronospirillum operosum]|uniref:FAH family protein n=1 Tax=Natronospirillum operosum TaxID=2759953 RepID=A0A4Z0WI94_9GAMM|nr:AraD1 family protein [Natronospirillum operosum]TGG95617.1 FAH family protein [Natronospirillum operosum]